MGFFDGIKKANATIGTAGVGLLVGGAAAASVAKGISSFKKAKHSRELDNKKFELELEKVRAENELKMRAMDQKERLEMFNAQVGLQKQQMSNDNLLTKMQLESATNIQLTGMKNEANIQLTNLNNQASIQKAQINSNANVAITEATSSASVGKAQAMYGNGGINTSGMFIDKENGIAIDNRNPNLVYNQQIVNGIPQMSMYPNMSHSLMFTPQLQMPNIGSELNGKSNMEILQKKLLDANQLLKSGAITEEEFLSMKQRILAGAM